MLIFFCFYLFNYLIFSLLIHSKTCHLFVTAQVVDQVCQGVVGRVPRKTDHTAGHSFLDELAPLVHLGVVLVAKMLLPSLLRPSGIYVILPFFVGLALLLLLGVKKGDVALLLVCRFGLFLLPFNFPANIQIIL